MKLALNGQSVRRPTMKAWPMTHGSEYMLHRRCSMPKLPMSKEIVNEIRCEEKEAGHLLLTFRVSQMITRYCNPNLVSRTIFRWPRAVTHIGASSLASGER